MVFHLFLFLAGIFNRLCLFYLSLPAKTLEISFSNPNIEFVHVWAKYSDTSTIKYQNNGWSSGVVVGVKRKLDSTTAPKELFDQGNRRNSTTLQSLQAIFQHFFFNMSFPSFFQVLETISSRKVRQVITMAILDYEWTPHSLKCTLFRVDTITQSYVTVRWIKLR